MMSSSSCNEKEGLIDDRWHPMRHMRDDFMVGGDEMRLAEFTPSCLAKE